MIEFHTVGEAQSRLGRCAKYFSNSGLTGKALVMASVLLGSISAQAKIVYVDASVASPGDGSTWANAYKYLRDALDNSTSADQIYVAKGVYYPDDGDTGQFGERDYAFELNGQKIYGGFAGTETSVNQRNPGVNSTILSGEIWGNLGDDVYGSFHVVVANQSSTLDGVVVEKGHASGSDSWNYPGVPFYDRGGGCFVKAGKTLTLQGCVFRGNRALEYGGAIMVEDESGKVVANETIFDQNEIQLVYSVTSGAPAGGAIKGNVQATNCKFTDNKVFAAAPVGSDSSKADGGAIAGNVTAIGCEFTGNEISSTGANAEATGGAIAGNVSASRCVFSQNVSFANKSTGGVAVGGATAGGYINAANCVFSANTSSFGILESDGTGTGGGGAIHTSSGNSTLSNCVFVKNTSRFRGGAIHAGTSDNADSLVVTNCTFLDNGVADTGAANNPRFRGSALCAGGIVRILNNVFWSTATTDGDFNQDAMVFVILKGVLRNSDVNYPTPSTLAPNLVKGGSAGLISSGGGDLFVGNINDTIVKTDPLFANAADADGTDDVWGTTDDGLRLTTGSPAIGFLRDPRVPSPRSFLPKDTLDVDEDGNTTETLPIDIASFVRLQDTYVDLGAYEFGTASFAPDIAVEYPVGTDLTDGVSEIDFSTFPGVATSVVIKNNGARDLKSLVITADGADAALFTYTQPLKTALAPGASTTFTVTFNPTTVATRNAVLHIGSNDPDEDTFDIKLRGETLFPDIAVEQPALTPLTDGTSTVDFGTVTNPPVSTREFTVRNTGAANLNIASVVIGGANAGDFRATLSGTNVVLPGGSTTFTVVMSPTANGTRTATATVVSNDPDAESSFLINLTGFAILTPEIAVFQPSTTSLTDGTLSAFGSVIKGQTYTKTFTIRNLGSGPLSGIAFSITGSDRFSFVKAPVTQLAAGASTTFTISFKPSGTGKKTAKLIIASDDADEAQFDINLSGTGILKTATKTKKASLALAASEAFGIATAGSQTGGTVTTVTTENGLKYHVLTVQKGADWSLGKHTVQVSSNLLDWYSGADHTTTLVNTPSVLSVRDNTPITNGAKRYIRLK